MASGFCPVSIFEVVFNVVRSTTLDFDSLPFDEKPRCTSGTATNAWTPGVSAISPVTLLVLKSTTTTFVAWERYRRLAAESIVKMSQPPSPPIGISVSKWYASSPSAAAQIRPRQQPTTHREIKHIT